MGINSFSIYPDLDGLGKAINEDYRILFGDHKTQDSIDQALTVLNCLGGAKIENEEEG